MLSWQNKEGAYVFVTPICLSSAAVPAAARFACVGGAKLGRCDQLSRLRRHAIDFRRQRPYADVHSRRHVADPAWQVVCVTQPSFGFSILQKSSSQHGIYAEGDSHEKQITSNDGGGGD